MQGIKPTITGAGCHKKGKLQTTIIPRVNNVTSGQFLAFVGTGCRKGQLEGFRGLPPLKQVFYEF